MERAIAMAREAAGGKDAGVGAAAPSQQALRLGLLDEVLVHLVPVLLGGGVRWFEHLGPTPVRLERTQMVASPNVTHLRFRVLR